jgi:hypothetical protein
MPAMSSKSFMSVLLTCVIAVTEIRFVAFKILSSNKEHANAHTGSDRSPYFCDVRLRRATKPQRERKADRGCEVGRKRFEAKSEAKSDEKKKPVAKKRETDEDKARRIAKRYGVTW